MDDPEAYGELDVRFLQPYQANKALVPQDNNQNNNRGMRKRS